LDRSLAAIARIGGRLVAVLLPLAALVVMHVIPSDPFATPLPLLARAVAATAALTAGLALLVAVTAALEGGRIRDLGDAAALGMLAFAFAVIAFDGSGTLGLGIGLSAASVAFSAGSAAGGRSLPGRRGRVVGIFLALVLVEACLAATMIAGALSGDIRMAPILLGGAAVVLGTAGLIGLDEPTRATALGIAASGAVVLALAGPTHNERVVGAAAVGLGAVVLGWALVANRLRRPPTALVALTSPAVEEAEFDAGTRLTRELRATLNDLTAARRTIDLQRAEIERAATVDPLTGLPSRGPTLERLRAEAAEARRYSHPVSVVMLDIDGFAELNHDHGLEIGDTILREMALRLRLRIREADALGRIGGDAFLAILPHTDESGAANFAQAVLDRLVERPVATARGEMTVKLSIGIALMRAGMTFSGEELLAAAEEALASAKAGGGNRIAFDRLHGLARLDERRAAEPDGAADSSTG
jgi:diguanylate cyclase (GGDEF)-like protein